MIIKSVILSIVTIFVLVSCTPRVNAPYHTVFYVDPVDENWRYYSKSKPEIDVNSNLFCLSKAIGVDRGGVIYIDRVCIPRSQEGKLLIIERRGTINIPASVALQYE